MDNTDSVKELILFSKRAAAADIASIRERIPLTQDFFRSRIRNFVLHKFLLREEELPSEDFAEISELSLSRSMKISPELVKEFDLAASCDGVSSVMAKKVLLFMAIQKEFGIELPAMATARLKTLDELADLVWKEVEASPEWAGRIAAGTGTAGSGAERTENNCSDAQKNADADKECDALPETAAAGEACGREQEDEERLHAAGDSIAAVQERIIREFNEIGDSFDQYAYLIELACQLPPLDEAEKRPDNLVSGCQSNVWLKTAIHDGTFCFASDSNTLIVKGILYLLEQLLNGRSCEDVAGADITFHTRTAIMDTFESSRQKGIGYVIKALQKAAADNRI